MQLKTPPSHCPHRGDCANEIPGCFVDVTEGVDINCKGHMIRGKQLIPDVSITQSFISHTVEPFISVTCKPLSLYISICLY